MEPQQRNETYMLGHLSEDDREGRRLDLQHNRIKYGIMDGRLVHKSIPESSLTNAVADICCGTGIWLNDLAERLARQRDGRSCIDFVGFDMSTSAFREDLAKNVRLVKHDCTLPFGTEYQGKFDLVNMRGLAYAIPQKSFPAVIQNATSLLRPGGYLQWLDTESSLWKSEPQSIEFQKALEAIMQERRDRELAPYLPDLMIRACLSRGNISNELSNDGVSVIHFGLAPGGASRLYAHDEIDLNQGFSSTVIETMVLLLQGMLLRKQTAQKGKIGLDDEDISGLQTLIKRIVDIWESGKLIVSGSFPLLIAQKAVD